MLHSFGQKKSPCEGHPLTSIWNFYQNENQPSPEDGWWSIAESNR
ncbi:hypothetical protein [Rubritalea tangerina]